MYSEDVVFNPHLINDNKIVEKLLRVCPPVLWEQDIIALANMKKERHTTRIVCYKMNRLMTESLLDLENSSGYLDFRVDIVLHRERLKRHLEEIYDMKLYQNTQRELDSIL